MDINPLNTTSSKKRIVIIGAGFGGLAAAKTLSKNPNIDIDLIDRNNYHLFQPLLYQVATSALSPADIAYPIRTIFRHNKNVQVYLGNVSSISLEQRNVSFDYGSLTYDYLIVATGAKQAYFGHDEWQKDAPALKSIEDALEVRRRILLAFEAAEYEADPTIRAALLTFVIVGGGPTGVELAGAIKEIALETVRRDFRNIDTSSTRVVLIEGNERLLKSMSPKLSAKAKQQLEMLGVEVRLAARVTSVNATGVNISEERISANNIFWAAGVQASSLLSKLGFNCDRAGRAIVNPDFSLPLHPDIFSIGDCSSILDEVSGEPVPGVAQAAIQAGEFVAKIILAEDLSSPLRSTETNNSSKSNRPKFKYSDKGSMATIGRAMAVAEIGNYKFSGFPAWLMWSVVHVLVLVGFRNRISVLLSWVWNYMMFSRGARIITGKSDFVVKLFKENFSSKKS